jgi:hypothetical protein
MIAPENGLKIASLIDLAGMQADVVPRRAEAKDKRDIDALMPRRPCPARGLAAARALQGEAFNPQMTLRAPACSGDGNPAVLPEPLKLRLQDAVRSVDPNHLPSIKVLDDINSDARAWGHEPHPDG